VVVRACKAAASDTDRVPDRDAVWTLFVLTWIALAVSGFAVFQLSRDARRKRRLWPWSIGLATVLFIGFMAAVGMPWTMVLGSVPILLVIAWLNLRMTRFCAGCGRMVVAGPISPPRFCTHCGTPLH
jgi:hypothetical protein